MSHSAIGFDGSRDGSAFVLATVEDDGTTRFELLELATPPCDEARRFWLNQWVQEEPAEAGRRIEITDPDPGFPPGQWVDVGWTEGVELQILRAMDDGIRTMAAATQTPTWVLTCDIPAGEALDLLARIDSLLTDEYDPEVGPDAARWSPDGGVTW